MVILQWGEAYHLWWSQAEFANAVVILPCFVQWELPPLSYLAICFAPISFYKCICCTKLSIYWHSNGRGPVFLQSPPHVTACLRCGGESKSCLLAGWVQPGSDQPSRIGGAAPSSHQRIHLGATCHAYCIQDGAFNCTWSNHGLCWCICFVPSRCNDAKLGKLGVNFQILSNLYLSRFS